MPDGTPNPGREPTGVEIKLIALSLLPIAATLFFVLDAASRTEDGPMLGLLALWLAPHLVLAGLSFVPGGERLCKVVIWGHLAAVPFALLTWIEVTGSSLPTAHVGFIGGGINVAVAAAFAAIGLKSRANFIAAAGGREPERRAIAEPQMEVEPRFNLRLRSGSGAIPQFGAVVMVGLALAVLIGGAEHYGIPFGWRYVLGVAGNAAFTVAVAVVAVWSSSEMVRWAALGNCTLTVGLSLIVINLVGEERELAPVRFPLSWLNPFMLMVYWPVAIALFVDRIRHKRLTKRAERIRHLSGKSGGEGPVA